VCDHYAKNKNNFGLRLETMLQKLVSSTWPFTGQCVSHYDMALRQKEIKNRLPVYYLLLLAHE
jgi:hypothetical protein